MKKVRSGNEESAPINKINPDKGISPETRAVSEVREVVRPTLEFSSQEDAENHLLELWRNGDYALKISSLRRLPISHDFIDSYQALEAKKLGVLHLLARQDDVLAIKHALEFAGRWRLPNDILLSSEVQTGAKICFENRLRRSNAQDEILVEFIKTFAIDQLELIPILTRKVLSLLKNAGVVGVIELNKLLPFPEIMQRDPQLKEAARAAVAILSSSQLEGAKNDATKIAQIFGLAVN